DGSTREWTRGRTLDVAAPVPGIERVLLLRRLPARCSGIDDGRTGLRQLAQPPVCLDGCRHHLVVGVELLGADMEPHAGGDLVELLACGTDDVVTRVERSHSRLLRSSIRFTDPRSTAQQVSLR